jgi:hypothetical protein
LTKDNLIDDAIDDAQANGSGFGYTEAFKGSLRPPPGRLHHVGLVGANLGIRSMICI